MRALWCPWCHEDHVEPYADERRGGLGWCHHCCKHFNRTDEARALFHYLWGRQQNSPKDYHPKVWNRLQEILNF